MKAKGFKGVLGIALSLVTNPLFAVKHVLTEQKMEFLLKLLLPLLLIPLFARRMWPLFLYGFAFTMLATRRWVYDISFQYSCVLFSALMAALPRGIEQISRGRAAAAFGLSPDRVRAALVAGMLATSMLISESYGVFGDSSEFRAGFYRLEKDSTELQKKRYRLVQEITAMIPAKASVTASEKLGSHLSSRDKIHKFPQVSEADYVVVWERDLKGPFAKKRLRAVRNSKDFERIKKRYDIVVYRRIDDGDGGAPPVPGSARRGRRDKKTVAPREPAAVRYPATPPSRRALVDGGPALLEGNGD
jgi:uncharacterized membrane protein